MRIKMANCDDAVDGGGRAMSGTIAEAQNAVNIENIDPFCALRESVSFPEEVPLGCALRESVSFTEEVPLGSNQAVGADFKKVNSWITVMTCSEAHCNSDFSPNQGWSLAFFMCAIWFSLPGYHYE